MMKTQTRTRTWMTAVFVTAVILSACMFCTAMPSVAYASDVQAYQVTGTYQQSEARTMLSMINSFRTGPDAWQWDESSTQKVQVSGLRELQYDYNLERIAMQRAMELVVSYSHTRPNSEICFTAYTPGYYNFGENIAIGTSRMDAQEAFELWQETDEPYEGQGHRRAMLSSGFGAVGVAHVVAGGCHYWVQEFGDRAVETVPTEANDAETDVEVLVDKNLITSQEYTVAPEQYVLTVGESKELPVLKLELRTVDTWSHAPAASARVKAEWTVKDSPCVAIEGTQIVALQEGTASLVATVGGADVKVPVQVNGKSLSISGAQLDISQTDIVYDGTKKEPGVTVTLDGSALSEGTDYTVDYENNTNAGTADVIVKGMGNYYGTLAGTFVIGKAENEVTVKQDRYTFEYSQATQTFRLNVKSSAGKIKYTSSQKKVKISRNGKVTIAKKFSGRAVITVRVTDKNYKTVVKKIIIRVKKGTN